MAKAAARETAEKKKREVVSSEKGVYVLYSDGTIRLDNVRASYPHVGMPQKNTDDEGNETETYGCIFLLDKTTHGAAMRICRDAIAAIEKSKPAIKGKPFKYAAAKKFIKNGDALDEDGDRLWPPECEGMWMVSSRERKQPRLRGADLDPKTGKVRRLTPEQAENLFYGGCYVTGIVRPWAQDNKYGKRANAGLVAIQFIRDGEPFGEGRLSDDDIDDSLDGVEGGDDGGWDIDDEEL